MAGCSRSPPSERFLCPRDPSRRGGPRHLDREDARDMIATPRRSRELTRSPRTAAAIATPRNGLRKWKVAARVAPMRRTRMNQIIVATTPEPARSRRRRRESAGYGHLQVSKARLPGTMSRRRPAFGARLRSTGCRSAEALRSVSVATESASTPVAGRDPPQSSPWPSRPVMITRTPAKPTKSPATATPVSRWPRNTLPSAATQSGRALARSQRALP